MNEWFLMILVKCNFDKIHFFSLLIVNSYWRDFQFDSDLELYSEYKFRKLIISILGKNEA